MEMNLICKVKKRGVDTFGVVVTAPNTDHATFVKNIPGVGKPFLLFASLPDGNPTGALLDQAPIVNVDAAVNQAAIDDMLNNPPWDLLVY